MPKINNPRGCHDNCFEYVRIYTYECTFVYLCMNLWVCVCVVVYYIFVFVCICV